MIRNRLRAWLGINALEFRVRELEELRHDAVKKSNDLSTALAEMRQLREMVVDPKTIPVQTRNSRQFRALVEQEP